MATTGAWSSLCLAARIAPRSEVPSPSSALLNACRDNAHKAHHISSLFVWENQHCVCGLLACLGQRAESTGEQRYKRLALAMCARDINALSGTGKAVAAMCVRHVDGIT